MNFPFSVKRPVYPLLAIASSVFLLLSGFLHSSRNDIFFIWLLAICIVYIIFGYGLILLKISIVLIPVGFITAFVSIFFKKDYITAIVTMGRILLLGISAITLITTEPVRLTRNLAMIRAPKFISLGMLITISFIPILIEESKRIREAMRSRAVNIGWYNLSTYYRSFIMPLLIQVLNMSELLAVSLETRAFSLSGQHGSVYKDVKFTLFDSAFALSIILISVATFILKAIL